MQAATAHKMTKAEKAQEAALDRAAEDGYQCGLKGIGAGYSYAKLDRLFARNFRRTHKGIDRVECWDAWLDGYHYGREEREDLRRGVYPCGRPVGYDYETGW